ncbi:uncharacterized protein SPAPADRAFT_68707 [Spathaspora passalidarum NRRL Y-27907]|uniref:Hyphally-regulated cell wall protein N-terminal domain-containing protein n=1 Tax=Spathaspora passalidarum (strain NRRL Y-27907 / 11-Y1) TaxID=619300 RepID=G3AUS8_SPAPN|nr:uncharacterized protein SPAPADRAFT_68707 [Spathaspora passalidarum NRRL Y-27907]EGW30634.1 hypothetical protein SPAPADRAFT_68707 [Spathaspora passalidarum NRRL Y-27907]
MWKLWNLWIFLVLPTFSAATFIPFVSSVIDFGINLGGSIVLQSSLLFKKEFVSDKSYVIEANKELEVNFNSDFKLPFINKHGFTVNKVAKFSISNSLFQNTNVMTINALLGGQCIIKAPVWENTGTIKFIGSSNKKGTVSLIGGLHGSTDIKNGGLIEFFSQIYIQHSGNILGLGCMFLNIGTQVTLDSSFSAPDQTFVLGANALLHIKGHGSKHPYKIMNFGAGAKIQLDFIPDAISYNAQTGILLAKSASLSQSFFLGLGYDATKFIKTISGKSFFIGYQGEFSFGIGFNCKDFKPPIAPPVPIDPPEPTIPSESEPSKTGEGDVEPSKSAASESEPSKTGEGDVEPSKSVEREVEPSKSVEGEPEPSKSVASESEPSKTNEGEVEPSKSIEEETESSKSTESSQMGSSEAEISSFTKPSTTESSDPSGPEVTSPSETTEIETVPTEASEQTEPFKTETIESSEPTNSNEKSEPETTESSDFSESESTIPIVTTETQTTEQERSEPTNTSQENVPSDTTGPSDPKKPSGPSDPNKPSGPSGSETSSVNQVIQQAW